MRIELVYFVSIFSSGPPSRDESFKIIPRPKAQRYPEKASDSSVRLITVRERPYLLGRLLVSSGPSAGFERTLLATKIPPPIAAAAAGIPNTYGSIEAC